MPLKHTEQSPFTKPDAARIRDAEFARDMVKACQMLTAKVTQCRVNWNLESRPYAAEIAKAIRETLGRWLTAYKTLAELSKETQDVVSPQECAKALNLHLKWLNGELVAWRKLFPSIASHNNKTDSPSPRTIREVLKILKDFEMIESSFKLLSPTAPLLPSGWPKYTLESVEFITD